MKFLAIFWRKTLFAGEICFWRPFDADQPIACGAMIWLMLFKLQSCVVHLCGGRREGAKDIG